MKRRNFIKLSATAALAPMFGCATDSASYVDFGQRLPVPKLAQYTTQSGGFGIGLSIVQSICTQHNITIELDSKLGEYTEFRLLF